MTADNPGVWFTSLGEEVTEDFEGFAAADCNVGTGPGQEPEMTCGIDFVNQAFTCIAPDDEVPAILGAASIPPETPSVEGTCPNDDGQYVNEILCIE